MDLEFKEKFWIDALTLRAIKKYPHRAQDIVQSLDVKQRKCKRWLVEELVNLDLLTFNKIEVLGGWYGQVLISYLDQHILYDELTVVDIDEEAMKIGRNIFFPYKRNIKWAHDDVTKREFNGGKNKLYINTSAEHFEALKINKGIYAVQSNNYFEIEEHTNCVNNEEELIEQYNFKEVYYKGRLEFDKYTRFMVIGEI